MGRGGGNGKEDPLQGGHGGGRRNLSTRRSWNTRVFLNLTHRNFHMKLNVGYVEDSCLISLHKAMLEIRHINKPERMISLETSYCIGV